MSWQKYSYVYETDIVAPGASFCLGDVKIESFNDKRVLNVSANVQEVALLGKETTLLQSAGLQTADTQTSILLTGRTKESNIF